MAKAKWEKLTKWHWRTKVLGETLDYWPTKSKWRFRGETQTGDVQQFIWETEANDEAEAGSEESDVSGAAWWAWKAIGDGVSVYILHEGVTASEAAPKALKVLKKAEAFYAAQA